MLASRRADTGRGPVISYRDVDDFDAYLDTGVRFQSRSDNSTSPSPTPGKSKSASLSPSSMAKNVGEGGHRVRWASANQEDPTAFSIPPPEEKEINTVEDRMGSLFGDLSLTRSDSLSSKNSNNVPQPIVISQIRYPLFFNECRNLRASSDRWKFSDDDETLTRTSNKYAIEVNEPDSHTPQRNSSLPNVDMDFKSSNHENDQNSQPITSSEVSKKRLSKWNQGNPPFIKGRTPAEPYRLPQKSEYSCRGQLLRAKGKWRKKWAKEWFIVQHNVLLTCTKEEPFLVKVCIPLKNIQSVESVKGKVRKPGQAGTCFQIRYIQAARRGKEKFATMECQATTPGEAQGWIANLKKFRDKACSPAATLTDFVARANAEAAIRQLHDAMKNSGLYQIVTRLTSSIAAEENYRLKEAFWRLREHQFTQTIQNDKAKFQSDLKRAEKNVEEALESGAKETAAAKRLAKIAAFLQKLSFIVDSKRHLILIELKKRIDLLSTKQTAENLQEVLLNALIVEHSLTAQRQINLRKKRMGFVLEAVFKRVLRNAFIDINSGGHLTVIIKSLRQNAMLNLMNVKRAEEKEQLAKTVLIWRTGTMKKQKREAFLLSLINSRRRADLHFAIRRWNASCILKNQHHMRAFSALEAIVAKKKNLLLSGALRQWSKWTNEADQLEALQIAANLTLANDQIVSSYNQIPMERACHGLRCVLERMRLHRISFAYRSIQTHGARRAIQIQNCHAAVSLLEKAKKAQVQFGFYNLLKFAFRSYYSSSQRLIGFMQLTTILRLIVKRKISEPFGIWRKNLDHLKLSSNYPLVELADLCPGVSISPERRKILVLRQIENIIHRIRLGHLASAMAMLRLNYRETDFLRGIARRQCLDRLCCILDRIRIATLASSLYRLAYTQNNDRSNKRDPPVVCFHQESDSPKTNNSSVSIASLPNKEHIIQELLTLPRVQLTRRHSATIPTLERRKKSCRQSSSDDLGRCTSFSDNIADRSSRCPLSNMCGKLVWLGIGITSGANGSPKVVLQGHRIISRHIMKSSTKPVLHPWKQASRHRTIKCAGIKKGTTFSSSRAIPIRPNRKPIERNFSPVTPYSTLSNYCNYSDNNVSSCCCYHHRYPRLRNPTTVMSDDQASCPSPTASEMWSSSSVTNCCCCCCCDSNLIDEISNHNDDSFHPHSHRPTMSPDAKRALRDQVRPVPSNSAIGSPSLHVPKLVPGRARSTRRRLSAINEHDSNLSEAASSSIGPDRIVKSRGMREHSDAQRDSLDSSRVEDWLMSSQIQPSHHPIEDPSSFNYLSSDHHKDNLPSSYEPSCCYTSPAAIRPHSSYLDFLLASSRGSSSYVKNATGETPDIDLSRIYNYVFDDNLNQRDNSRPPNYSNETMTRTSNDRLQPSEININIQSIIEDHGNPRPDSFSTSKMETTSSVEERSIEVNSNVKNCEITQTKSCHRSIKESPPASLNSSNIRKVYRAVVPQSPDSKIKPETMGNGTQTRQSPPTQAKKRLLIVMGETGGAGGQTDLTVIESDVVKKKRGSQCRSKRRDRSLPIHQVILSDLNFKDGITLTKQMKRAIQNPTHLIKNEKVSENNSVHLSRYKGISINAEDSVKTKASILMPAQFAF